MLVFIKDLSKCGYHKGGDNMKHRYIVFDIYDVGIGEAITKNEIIGKANTKQEVRKICRQQVEDTDGECNIMIFDKEQRNFIDYNEI